MRTFKFLVADSRYSVPTLRFVEAGDDRRARALAALVLAESPHHLGVEVWEDDLLLFRLAEGGA